MAIDIFMALLLQLKTEQEKLIAQAMRQNEFVCQAKQKRTEARKTRVYWQKPGRTD